MTSTFIAAARSKSGSDHIMLFVMYIQMILGLELSAIMIGEYLSQKDF